MWPMRQQGGPVMQGFSLILSGLGLRLIGAVVVSGALWLAYAIVVA